jgi:glutamine amidotransferase
MIGIIDIKMCNLGSVKNSLDYLKMQNKFIESPSDISICDKLILPGVGAFGTAMERLNKTGFAKQINIFVKSGKPILGICLGMQLLMESSEEYGHHLGLGLIKGRVLDFSDKIKNLPIPHIGWNDVKKKKESIILRDIKDKSSFYFVHSFYCDLVDKNNVVGTTDYGFDFDSVLESGNIFACQFHPEKSQQNGLSVLDNFGKIA